MSVVDAETHIKNVDAFARVLSSATAGDQICQWLVTNWLSPYQAIGAVLLSVRNSADLEIVGAFGFPEEAVASFQRRKIWERWPLTDAARDGQLVHLAGHKQILKNYPAMNGYVEGSPETSIVAQPVLAREMPIGVLGVVFDGLIDKTRLAATKLDLIASFLSVRLSGQNFVRNGQQENFSTNGNNGAEMLGKPLTERQRLILQLICEGKTNPLIAYTLGYSESTVRQESMKIYRKLGVANRTAAAELIKSRGLEPFTK